ncbi:MAG: ABC transporter permease [Propionibacteriaceae bacterium]|jgi:ABC-type dipeptide/oligopeptide/nickel transport system permease subunit|nr:ABC transporter permease [Propionibacteriaceae bacterium]
MAHDPTRASRSDAPKQGTTTVTTTPALAATATPAPEFQNRARFTVPGLALLRSTHGLQRGMLLTGIVLVGLFIVVGLFAPLIAPYGFAEIFDTQQPPSRDHWLGTTVGGYDVFSRIVFGARTAIEVIVLACLLSTVIGVPLGLVSGYLGGWLDRVLVLVMDALYAFPSLLLAIVVSIMVSGGSSGVFSGIMAAALSITVVFIPQYFRVTRNATIQVKAEPYVDAARVMGAKPGRIMFRHVLTNVSQSIPVIMTLNASESILTLASLGFLGFGIEPTSAAEWGYDLNKAMSDTLNGIWWTGIFPGIAIVLIVTGVTLIGESLNDVLNPLLRTRGGTTTADEEELDAVVSATAITAPVFDENELDDLAALVEREPIVPFDPSPCSPDSPLVAKTISPSTASASEPITSPGHDDPGSTTITPHGQVSAPRTTESARPDEPETPNATEERA